MAHEKTLVKFKGAAMYAQVHPGQERGPHPDAIADAKAKGLDITKDRHYEILVECSEDLFKRLKANKIPAATTLKEFEGDDKKYIKLKSTKIRGDYVFEDVLVTNADGEIIEDLIGNGSVVEAVAELAPIKGRSGNALRLKSVKVLSLVEYVPPVVNAVYLNDDTSTTTKATKKDIF